ncbi:MAG TPA: hypothetical protein VM100_14400 [Longimicrobiales bacterium]|nr:hypothetical protein [Longimicrobiales bacterium]
MRKFILTLFLFMPSVLTAQNGSELFLVRLKAVSGTIRTDSVIRITNRIGYDNQPSFVPNSNLIRFTVIDSTTHADIWGYDLTQRIAAPITRTSPESEYSATPIPGSDRFSVVRVEADSTQRLWSFAADGSDPRIVLEAIKPVGYHAWIDENTVAAFVLGNPSTLQVIDVQSGITRIVARNVGRALQKVPSRRAFSFVQNNPDSTSSIFVYDVNVTAAREITKTLPGNEYHVWLSNGTLIGASGSVLFQWRTGDRGWNLLADLSASNITGISRLALSPDEQSLIVVATDPPIFTSQNPSPMVERTRTHERIPRTETAGVRDSVSGPNGKFIPIFIPEASKKTKNLNLVVHFHGSAPLVSEYAAAQVGHDHIIATVQLGSGSGIYDRSFNDPAVFDSLLARVRAQTAASLQHDVAFRSIILSGWSAGYGAVRAILRDSAHAELIDGVMLLDGLHTGYIPDKKLIADGGQLDTANFPAFLRYARWAMTGRKRFLITHSEIFPASFASTTESSSYMIDALGLKRTPVLEWGAMGMQQLSLTRMGRFEVRGFAGNAAQDHVDHLHALGYFVRELERM